MNWKKDRDRLPLNEEYDRDLQLQVLRDMLSNLPDILDKSIGSFSFDLLSPVSIKIAQLIMSNQHTRDLLLMENMTGKELETRVRELSGIKRKSATKASGDVTITGQSGTSIEQGMLVASDRVRFIVQEDAVVPESGEVTVNVKCEDWGSVGNVGVGMIRYFPVTVSGLTAVTNLKAFDNGYDEETDESLYERYIEYLQTPATSGNKYHYIQWAKEVEGVGQVAVQGAEEVGAGNVRVVIIDRNQDVASEELLQDVYEYIETQRPIGANVTVDTGIPKSIDIEAEIMMGDKHTINKIVDDFEVALEQYRKDIAFKEDYVSYAKVSSVLLGVEGVLDIHSLTLNGDTENISLKSEEIPVFPTPDIKPRMRRGLM